MKLQNARLCADCEEIYEVKELYGSCPACSSEAFALLGRWVPPMSGYKKWLDDRKEVVAYDSEQEAAHA